MARSLALAVSITLLVLAPEAQAHEGHGDCGVGCDVGQALLIAIPVLYGGALLTTDAGTLVHLARSPGVPRAWSLSGVVLWTPPTVVSAVGLVLSSAAMASPDETLQRSAVLPLSISVVGLALGTASLAVQFHALLRASPASQPLAGASSTTSRAVLPALFPGIRTTTGTQPGITATFLF